MSGKESEPPGSPGPGRADAGELNAAIARAIVRLHRDYTGRGPTQAKAFFRDDVVVVVLREHWTRAERVVVTHSGVQAIREVRRQLHETMRDDLVRVVEELTGALVVAVLGDTHADPDIAVHVFVLDRNAGARHAVDPAS
jgi:uncharacterized protein YbcI